MRVEGFVDLKDCCKQLPVSDADIVTAEVSSNHLVGALSRDVFAPLTDNKTKLGFIIQFVRCNRQVDACMRCIDTVVLLVKPDLDVGLFHTTLSNMIRVFETNDRLSTVEKVASFIAKSSLKSAQY